MASILLTKALRRVTATRKDRLMEMFNKYRGTGYYGAAAILLPTLIDVFGREDRIVWAVNTLRNEIFPKPDEAKEKSTNLGELVDKAKHALHLEEFEHFFGLDSDASTLKKGIFDRVFKNTDKLADIFKDFKKAEQEYIEESKGEERLILEPQDMEHKYLGAGGGFFWFLLPRGYCKIEGDKMAHCGNINPREGDLILSLREPKVTKKGQKAWAPHATFILNKGVLVEMKGFGNRPPSEKYHSQIVELLKDKKITEVNGTERYAPESNFKIADLSDSLVNELANARPDLLTYQDLQGKVLDSPKTLGELVLGQKIAARLKVQADSKSKFVDYVLEFYGKGGLYADFFGNGVSKKDVEDALKIRLKNKKLPFDGDSFDRELIRDIMLYQRGERKLEYSMDQFFKD